MADEFDVDALLEAAYLNKSVSYGIFYVIVQFFYVGYMNFVCIG